jgi:hypothetical protein
MEDVMGQEGMLDAAVVRHTTIAFPKHSPPRLADFQVLLKALRPQLRLGIMRKWLPQAKGKEV